MLRFLPGCLKTKKMCKSVVNKLQFVIRYVTDRYKTQNTKINIRVIKLLIIMLMHKNLFLVAIR